MAKQIVNGAPMVIEYGTEDLSRRQLPREPEAIPQHLPKFYIFAQKGPSTPQLVSGAERISIYGAETFNERGKYCNHATIFANLANGNGNACMLQRLIPEDAGPESNIICYMDVLSTEVDTYQRNVDGSIKTDALGDPIVSGTTQGHKVKFVITHASTDAELQNFGSLPIAAGDQVDAVTSTQSERYPIWQAKFNSKGKVGDLSGIRMWAPTVKTAGSMPTRMMSDYKAYPYNIAVVRKPDELTSAKVVPTLFGEQNLMVTFKRDTIDPLTDKELYIGDTFVNAYQNLVDLRYPKLFADFSEFHVYQDNIELLTEMFHEKEIPFINGFSDFTDAVEDKHLFNFVTGVSSFNVPYHSFVFADNANSTRFSEFTNVFAKGGSDGTMSDATHAQLAKVELERYLDENDEVQDVAVNVESIFYDSGYPIETKYALINSIAVRKNTAVILGTYVAGERELTASEEHSLAIALRTRLRNFPESDYFGTPVLRGMIVGRSGKLRNSKYQGKLPLTAEVLIKSSKYMGASNGEWKNGLHFDGAPGSIVESMYDISITWVPTSVRNRNWDVGLNWVQAYDRRSFFFPALKTVYDDDTSVLNSYITMMAICHLNTIAHSAWREFSGVSHLSNAQLADRVNAFVNKRVANKFDGRFVIRPETFFTDMDQLRGFSWTLPIKIYAANMKTVMTTYVQSFRIEDLQG